MQRMTEFYRFEEASTGIFHGKQLEEHLRLMLAEVTSCAFVLIEDKGEMNPCVQL